jgi:endonuclease/exonuclease/phosphatase family metal-dependent hydrolase
MESYARDIAPAAKPAPHYPPIVVNRAPRHSGSRLRVVLLNAAGGRHFRDIAACLQRSRLRGADIVLLCEVVSKPRTARSPARDVAAELGAMLGMSCAHVPEYGLSPDGVEIGSYMGNAILSSVPFDDVAAVAMHRPRTPLAWPMKMRTWRRIGTPTGLVTTLKFSGKQVTVGVAHLHSRCAPAERARQMATYLDSFPTSGRAIFGGDLNTTTTELLNRSMIFATARQIFADPDRFHAPQTYEPLFGHLREAGLKIDGVNVPNRPTFTFSGLIPRRMRPKLDWLAVRDLHPVAGSAAVVTPRSRILMRRISDHDFVTVDIEL